MSAQRRSILSLATDIFLSFQTGRPEQTSDIRQIKKQSDQGLHLLPSVDPDLQSDQSPLFAMPSVSFRSINMIKLL